MDFLAAAIRIATPLLLAALGGILSERAGVFAVGLEGMMLAGAFAAALAAWAALAAAIHLSRQVHEVLVTLLLNFVAALLVQQALAGPLGEFGAGFLQSPRMPAAALLPRLVPGLDAHPGFLIGVLAAVALSFVLWRTRFGFSIRVAGASRAAAAYAGFSAARITWGVMLLSGAVAGLAGGIEVLGVQRRLIEGFSMGFGFKAVTVALLGALEPLAVVPAALFVGFLEAGALSMQRQVGVPSSLVAVIEGLTMLLVLVAAVRRRAV